MEVTIEEKGAFDRDVIVTIPAERVGALIDEELSRLGQNLRLPGFRPGRIPRKVLASRFRGQVAAGVAEQLFKATYMEALQEKSLRPVDMPVLELGAVESGKDFTYTAAIQILPETTPQGYKGMPLKRFQTTVTDADVDLVVGRIREANTEFATEEGRQAADGDQVVMDFEGSIDGEVFEGGTAQGYPLTLGSGRFIPGFEEQLMGAAAGDEREVKVPFPEAYHNKELAGKEALFKCTVKEVQAPTVPELDDALAEKAGVKEGGIAKMREQIREQLEREVKTVIEQDLKKQILDALMEANRMALPSQMVDREVEALAKRNANPNQPPGEEPPPPTPEERENLRPQAEERVILGLVIGAIATGEQIEADEAGIESYLDEMSVQFGEHANAMKKFIRDNPERMEEVKSAVLEKNVMAWIVEQGEVTEQESSYEALMKENAA